MQYTQVEIFHKVDNSIWRFLCGNGETLGCVYKVAKSQNIKGEKKMASKQKMRIKLRAYDHQLLDQSAQKIVDTAKRTGAVVSGPVPLPTEKEVVTILRAVHKYKDSREQFEMRTHKRLIDVLRPTKETTAALENLELPAGVNIVMEIK